MYRFQLFQMRNRLDDLSYRIFYRLVKNYEEGRNPMPLFDRVLGFEETESYELAGKLFGVIEAIGLKSDFINYKNSK